MSKEHDIRVILEDGYDIESLIKEIGHNLDWVREAVVLKNDGFANMLPDETTRQVFVNE